MKTKHLQTKRKVIHSLIIMCIMLPALFYPQLSKAGVTEIHQSKTTVSGFIKDTSGEPIIGASITEKGTTNGTVTDIDGKYTLSVSNPNAILQISYVGYLRQEIAINSQKNIDVVMKEDLKILDEVVIIGFGTQRKGDVTSSVSSVKAEDFQKGFALDAGQLLQGRVAGLSITTPSGDPTENTQIMLRGTTTLKAGTSPLVLIDGVPGTLNSVAPEDIESMDILKDGSAAAIYGSQGTNGVIIITTKRVKGEMPATIEYNGYISTQTIKKRANMLTAGDYRRLISEGVKNLTDLGYDTDWLDEITRTPITNVHNISLKGGTGKTNYIANVNYRELQGIFIGSGRKDINVRADITHSMFDDKLKINSGIMNTTTNFGGFDKSTYRQAIIRNPTDRIYDDQGNYQERSLFQYANPVAMINEFDEKNESREMRWNINTIFNPIKDLSARLLLSKVQNSNNYGHATTFRNIATTRDGLNGTATRSANSSYENYVEFTTDYKYDINKHRFSILGGYTYEKGGYNNMYMYNYNFITDQYSFNNIGAGNALKAGNASMSSFQSEYRRASFFSRFTYNYDDKYLFLASVRRDGSSKFGANHQWGTFPAASVGWRINNEPFLKDKKFIDDLKIRAGVGVTGTEPTDPYMSLTLLGTSGFILNNGEWINQIIPTSNPNPDLRWERKTEYNFGLDYAFLNGRINGTLDYYIRRTTDMLWDFQVPVPPYLYSTITANVGVMDNKGFEALINIIPVRTKDIEWQTSFNYSSNTNKLVSLSNDLYATTNTYFDQGYTGDPIQQSTHRNDIGKPIGNFFGYKSVDIDENGAWILENKDGERIKFADRTAADKQYLGNGLPKWYAGWINSFRYKNWDFNVTMRGAFGFQVLNSQRMFYENPTIVYNRLASAFDKVYGKQILAVEQEYVSYYIEDGDYWKIDNVTLGYTIPIKNRKFLKMARVYMSGLNLLTISGYKGIDPEVNRSGLAPGIDDRDKYPTTRTFTLGLGITF